jgi:hypothetical protein
VSRQAFVIALLAVTASRGYVKRSGNVAAAYISPPTYKQFNCRQLAQESGRVLQTGVQARKHTGDIDTTASVIIFWLAGFLLSGDDAQTGQLARLTGAFEAIQNLQDELRFSRLVGPLAGHRARAA